LGELANFSSRILSDFKPLVKKNQNNSENDLILALGIGKTKTGSKMGYWTRDGISSAFRLPLLKRERAPPWFRKKPLPHIDLPEKFSY